MLKKFQALIDRLGSHASLWPFLAGSSAASAIAGWAAHATQLLNPYAPFSWVAAIILGALISACVYALFARAKLWIVQSNIQSDFYKSSDRINPLDESFQTRRIKIADLVSPIEPIIRSKTFIDCELIGPANIALSGTAPGKLSMNGTGFIKCNACRIKDNIFVTNAILFEDCTFIRGKLFGVTLFVNEYSYEFAKKSMPGMPWLSID
jgi:hypothetical protein